MKPIVRNSLVFVVVAAVIAAGVYAQRRFENDTGPMPKEPYTDWRTEAPGKTHKITVADLPKPYESESVFNGPRLVARPANAWPKVPPGFKVELYAEDLDNPRLIRTAPNGDLFLVESSPGIIKVFRGVTKDGKPQQTFTFTTGLRRPFGVAWYPLGKNPQWLYVANTDSIVRFPYRNGDTKARGEAEVVVKDIPGWGMLTGGGHWTRDVAFSLDGKRMFVAVGSKSNVDDPDTTESEKHRANILEFTPEGKSPRVFAWGIRNPVGIAVHPKTGELWASVNERDGLGDNLPPDYITSVKENGFYGWPWYYIGPNQDPRHKGKRPELKDKVIVPDVLVQPHMASLQMTFYTGTAFPKEYVDDIFASEHGSWNRRRRGGYSVIRVPLRQTGKASGEYQDFMTGFVTEDGQVWGRPVGVTVGSDGALYVTDDGSESIWRISYTGK